MKTTVRNCGFPSFARLRVLVYMLVLALAVALLGGCASATGAARGAASAVPSGTGDAAAALPSITVNATSEVKVVPDKAQIGVAVTTQAATAAETQEQNTEAVNAVVDALAALGIAETSIQTSYTNLNPRYDYSTPMYYEESSDVSSAESESTNIVGYEMTTALSVKDLDIDQVAEVLSACVAAGANNTDGIQYYSSEYDAKYAEALAAAVEAAHAKAEVLAAASGASLGGVISVVEGYQNTAYRYDNGIAMEAAADGASMKVMPGEVGVSANITVSYEIS